MRKIFITGVGIVSENIDDISKLRENNIHANRLVEAQNDVESILSKTYKFKSKDVVSREDRSLLNKIAHLAIDSTMQTFKSSENVVKFTENERMSFPVFIASESAEHNLSPLDNFLSENNADAIYCLDNIGLVKKHLNPLDMLRTLSTNPLYHVSKIFSLQGGGYPIRRMSLSGLCALQESCFQLQYDKDRALVLGIGDLTNPENLCAFLKMGLIRTKLNKQGILPSYGAASVIMECEGVIGEHKLKYAQIHKVKSIYKNDSAVTQSDWTVLFDEFKNNVKGKKLHVILYDNGVDALATEERLAVSMSFPDAVLHSYKKYIGYTGKANNLIDLVISLADKRIPIGSNILINGIGTSSGFGSILIEKINHA